MSWQDIAQLNGIEQPVNGSWEQAICERLGILEPINGSWTQALAQYGPFPEPQENNSTLTDFEILNYQAGAGPKGSDIYEFQFQINANASDMDENKFMIITNFENGFNVNPSNDGGSTNMNVRNICAPYYGDSYQAFYFAEFYTNSPDTLYFEVQVIDTIKKVASEIKIFTITLEPPL